VIARRYFRCDTCLSVLAIEGGDSATTCGACEGALEFMGGVVRAEGKPMACACDARCTFAVGPHCNCHCEGRNHGSGMVVVPSGSVAKPADARRAREKAGEWRAALVDFEAAVAEMDPKKKRRAAGVLRFAKSARVHRLRLAYLRDFVRGDEQIADVLELDLWVGA
jgi:hypothetical protein